MKIGYPCQNGTLSCKTGNTFRLKNYSAERLIEKVRQNIECIREILDYNVEHGILFFRISSDTVPFASHPVCQFDWKEHFTEELLSLGEFIRQNEIRISMHPDQFTLLNSLDKDVYLRSVDELKYHVDLLDSMQLDLSAKVQIHVGGVYGDKEKAIERFILRYDLLENQIKDRLAIENDDRLYSLADCMKIHSKTSIPVIFDSFHHNLHNSGELTSFALETAASTWKRKDGILMVDYSSQEPNGRIGKHARTIDRDDFRNFLQEAESIDFDLMLEIKDKEKSAAIALEIATEFNSSIGNEIA